MAEMTPDERRRFLSEGTRTAKIATVGANGGPHVVPIWFVLDGDDVIFTTGEATAKGRAIRRDQRVALCVDDEHPPYAFVTIEGTPTTSTDLDEMLFWATRIAARYMGADQADAYGRRNAAPGELLVRVTPTKFISDDDVAGW